MTYVPALDGVRALACMAVILCHAFPMIFQGGAYGVDVFFVLSGFLITGILLNDIEERGKVCFKEFYIRRARRLLPALIVMLVMTMFLWLVVYKRPGFFRAAFAVIGYYANWSAVKNVSSLGLMPHAWSLSIEEQFYLVWPVLLLILVTHQRSFIGIVTLRIAAILTLTRITFYVLGSPLGHPCSTLARLDGLLVGCACAAFLRYRPSVAKFWTGRRGTLVAVSCGAALLGFVFFPPAHNVVPILILGSTLVVLYPAAIILHAASGGESKFARCLEHPLMIAIGKRSYGLYLYHVPIIHAFPDQPMFLKLAATFAMAWLSYRYIERPFLRPRSTVKRATDQTVALPVPV